MPTYEYECKRCGRIFELFQPITAKPKRTLAADCEECDNRAPVRRLIGTGAGVIFKGAGFYQTDYRSESYKKAAKADAEAAKPKDKESTGKPGDKSTPTASKTDRSAARSGAESAGGKKE